VKPEGFYPVFWYARWDSLELAQPAFIV
ncbi:hypothetical protein A2U01_0117109, partial [Trifolium medium]|nr:hypothetical protein [Trifolium medium]